MNFSNNLIVLRKKKGYTLDEIATKTGFSRSQWNNYELGSSFPKFLDFIKISNYFDISETDLIHKNLETDTYSTIIEPRKIEDSQFELQNKLIQMQEKEIARLEKELELLKATGHEKSKSRTAVEFRDEPKPELKK